MTQSMHIFRITFALIVALLTASCSKPDSAQNAKRAALTLSSSSATALASGSAHPPIDCPLHQHGIDPTKMRPFEEVAKYIEFLERPERALWQKPDVVVNALGLKGNEVVYDLGAGSGYFSFRFSKALPKGKVIAADTEAEMVRHIHHRVMADSINNIEAKLIKPDDPDVSKESDLVFVCDVLHHVSERPAWLAKLVGPMKSGARLVIIEFKEGKLPEGPPEGAKITKTDIINLITKAGLVFDKEDSNLLPYQVLLTFHQP
jgi:SAM-dependent methyltransferase